MKQQRKKFKLFFFFFSNFFLNFLDSTKKGFLDFKGFFIVYDGLFVRSGENSP